MIANGCKRFLLLLFVYFILAVKIRWLWWLHKPVDLYTVTELYTLSE